MVAWYYPVAIFGFMVVLLIVSFLFRKYVSNLADYYVIGRVAGWPIFACTLLATWVSMWTLMGGPGLVWNGWGPFAVQSFYIGSAIGVVLCTFLVSPALRRAEYLTVPDFFGDRFASNRVRSASVLALIVGLYFYIVLQVVGGAILFEQLFNIPYFYSILIFLGVLLLCLIFSGMWSIVVTDIAGFCFFLIAGIIFPIVMIKMVGGVEATITGASAIHGGEYWTMVGKSGMTTGSLIGNIISWAIILGVAPHLLARSYICKDTKEILKGGIATLIGGFVMTFILFLGFVALTNVVEPGTMDPDYLAVHASLKIMPPILGVIYLIGAFSAGTTTANAQFLTCAQGFARDIYQKIINPNADDKKVIKVTVYAMIVVAIATVIVAAMRPWLLVIAGTITGMILAFGYFPTLILGLFWDRFTAKAAEWTLWASVPISVFVVVTWTKFKWFQPHPSIWGLIIGFGLAIILSCITKQSEEEKQAVARLKPVFFPKKPLFVVNRSDYTFLAGSSVLTIALTALVIGLYQGWWW